MNAADLRFEFSRGPTGGTIGQLNTVGDDVCPAAGVNGCDFDQTDDIVRTNDGVGYNFAIQVDPPGDNVFIDTTLKPGMVWDQLPGSCNPLTSFITGDGTAANPSRLYCDLGFKSSFAANLVFVARALGDNPNGTVSGIESASFGGESSTTIDADTTVAQDVTITAKPQYNLRKVRHSSAPYTDNGVQGYRIRYQFWIDTWKTDTNGDPTDDPDPLFGNELAAGDVSFTEDARDVSDSAYILACSRPGSSLFPDPVYNPANPEGSVLNAGTVSCDATGPGTRTAVVTVTGADLSLSHYPTETRTGRALPGDRRVASFGMIDVFLPISDITAEGGELPTVNRYTGFNPRSITNQPNFNGAPQDATGGESDEDNDVAFLVREGTGSFSHTYRCHINGGTPPAGCARWWDGPTSATSVASGDGPVEAAQEFASYTYYRNNRFSSATDVSVCSVFDSRYYEPELYNATQAVRCVGQCGTLGVDYVIEYGNGYVSSTWQDAATVPADAVPNECSAPASNWNTSFAAASAAGDITKIRVRRLTPLQPGNVHAATTRLRAKPLANFTSVPNGTLLKTWGSMSSSLFFPTFRECQYQAGAWETPLHTTNGCGDRMFYSGSLARIEKRTVPNNLINTIDAGGKVTFELFPSFTSLNAITDNVTIVDTLPVGGIYVPGSSRIGGALLDPVVTGDVATGQVLTWDLGTLPANVPIDTITFEMRTPLQTPNGTNLDNTARIDVASDGSSPEQRGAIRRVTVTAPASMLMAKSVSQPAIPQDGTIDYVVEYLNTTSSSFFEMDIIDVLPYDADARFPPSNFSGQTGLQSVTPQSSSAQFYFTKDDPSSIDMDPNLASNDFGSGSTNWCPATALHALDPAASPSNGGASALCPATPAEITAFRLIDTEELPSSAIRQLSFQMSTTGNFGGDLYVNQAQGTSDGISLSPQTPFVETRVFELPQIGLAKENVDVTDGVVTLRFRLENLGNTPFRGVSIIDDLDVTFGAGTYEIETPPALAVADASGTIVVDTGFTGNGTTTNLLDASSVLRPLEFAIVEVKVRVTELTDQGNGVGVYENSAVISGTTPGGAVVTDTSNDGADPDLNDDGDATDPNEDTPTPISIPIVQGIEVVKSSSTALLSNPIAVGDNIEYTFVIENTGNVTLPDVTLTDPLFTPSDITSDCTFPAAAGVLRPSQTATCTALYPITALDIENVGVTNQAVAAGTGPEGPVEDDSDSGNAYDESGADDDQTTTPLPRPSLQVVKSDVESFSTPVRPGDTVAYTIVVENTGNVPLSSVALSDTLTNGDGTTLSYDAPGLAFVSADGGSAEGALLVGEKATYTATYSLTQEDIDSGSVTNTATATGVDPDTTSVSDISDDPSDPTDTDTNANGDGDDPNLSLLAAEPGISLTKAGDTSAFQTPVRAGDVITYTFVVTNTGNVTLDGVTLTDDGLTNADGDSLTLAAAPAWQDPGDGSAEGTILPGASATYTATYALTQDDIDSGGIENTATARGDDPSGDPVSDVSDDPADAEDADPNGDGNPDDPVTTPLAAEPGISLTKAGDTSAFQTPVRAGDVITYTFVVTNTGNVTLDGVTLTDDGLTNADGDSLTLAAAPAWQDPGDGSAEGTILPGATATYTASYALTQDDIDSGGIENTATARGDDPSGDPVSDVSDDPADAEDADPNGDGNPDDPVTTPLVAGPSISLTKAGDTSAFQTPVRAGDVITYTFVVTNTGNVTLDGVTLTDDGLTNADGDSLTLAAAPAWQDPGDGSAEGTILPGATATYTATYALTQDDIDSGGIENTATARGDDPSGDPVSDVSDDPADAEDADPNGDGNPDDPVTTPLVAEPELVAEKADDLSGLSEPVSQGDVITYEITIQNTGNVTLSNLALVDTLSNDDGDSYDLSGALMYVSSDQGSAEGDLLVGETARYTLEYTLTQDDVDSGAVENTITATATDPNNTDVEDISDDPGAGNSSDQDPTRSPFTPEPRMDVVKIANTNAFSDPVRAGDEITYTMLVKNIGNVTLDNLVLTDTMTNNNGTTTDLSADITFDSADAGSPEGLLEVGETATYRLTYALTQEDIDYGGVSNMVLAEATDPSNNDVSDLSDDPDDTPGVDDPTVVDLEIAPSLNVLKSADTSNLSAPPVPGETVAYLITVANTGNVTINSVALTDALTDGAGDPLVLSAPVAFDSASLGSPDGTLLVGETATYRAEFDLTTAAIASGFIENTVTAIGSTPTGVPVEDVSDDPADPTDSDPNGDQNPDDPTVTPLAVPSMLVFKTADESQLSSPPMAGDEITYTITVENTGNVRLSSVALSDNLTNDDGTATDLSAQTVFVEADQGSPQGILEVGEVATYRLVYALTQEDIDSGGLTNTASADAIDTTGNMVSTMSDDPTDPADVDDDGNSLPDDPTVSLLNRAPSIALTKTDDVTALQSPVRAGDVITYVFEATNTGNVSLDAVSISDNALTNGDGTTLSLTSGPDFVSATAGSLEGSLQVGEVATYRATYALTQADLDSGSVENAALAEATGPGTSGTVDDLSDDPDDTTDADTNGNSTPDDPTLTDLPSAPLLAVTKSITDVVQVFPFVYDVTYAIGVENTGNGTAFNVSVLDDLAAALTPGTIMGTPQLVVSGFDGTGQANPAYVGDGSAQLLTAGTNLAPDGTGEILIEVRVNFAAGFTTQTNTAYATADGITDPVPSDDPTVTPQDTSDVNPTPPPVVDEDLDGSPDGLETTDDRDGDGIVDSADYDPLGYFYCEENGNILSGGLISVTGPAGTQTGTGSSSNITIVSDGTDGSFQWYVTVPGTYVMSYTLPSTGVASVDRVPAGPIDVTSLLPSNPASLGGSEVGATGVLSDFTAAGNPFFVEFIIEEEDPTVLNNNIPLRFCGMPIIATSKDVVGEPVVLGDQRLQIVYEVSIENTGDTRLVEPTLVDDLDAVFGAGRHEVLDLTLESAPATFGATENALYNGASDTNLLSAGGTLEPGESATLRLTLAVSIDVAGTYTNTVVAGGASPLDGGPIEEVTDDVDLDLTPPPERGIEVTKTSSVRTAVLGDVVPYTIVYENTHTEDFVDVTLVDLLPEGFIYRTGSARLDGVALEPGIFGRRLTWEDQSILAGQRLTLELSAVVGPRADPQEFRNSAWVEDPGTGRVISTVGVAIVERELEAIFDCTDIIGTVFDDLNHNGYQDGPYDPSRDTITDQSVYTSKFGKPDVALDPSFKGEPGLAGVRLSTTTGTLITTDQYGRFNVPCAALPGRMGQNFVLKLDTRTLPTGYRVTTENPRAVRVTAGKFAKINFGASISRIVDVDVSGRAFLAGSNQPKPSLEAGLVKLLDQISETPSVLRLSYFKQDEDRRVIKRRVDAIEDLIRDEWKRRDSRYKLIIERTIKRLQ